MTKYVYETLKCPYCDKLCKSTGLHRHVKSHGEILYLEYRKSNQKKRRSIKLDNGNFKCSECSFENSQKSVSSHWWRNHTDEGKNFSTFGCKHSHHTKRKYSEGQTAWNKGLTKETDYRVRKYAETNSRIQKEKVLNGTFIPRKMGESARLKLSQRQSLSNSGGKCKWFTVAGQKVQGTYEKYFAEHLELQNISWVKIRTNNHIFKYVWKNKIRSYSPDFYLPEFDLYVETKGFWWGDDEEKMENVREQCSEKKVIVLFGKKKIEDVCLNIRENLLLEPVWSW